MPSPPSLAPNFAFGAAVVLLLLLATPVRSQSDGCSLDPRSVLPLAYNDVSGLTCQPIWNNFILRYSQSQDHVLTVVLSTPYTGGWVGMGFSKNGRMVGSSAMVGWIDKAGVPHVEQYYLRSQSPSGVVVNDTQLLTSGVPPVVVTYMANIYLAFKLKLSAPVTKQQLIFALGTSTPVDNRLTMHRAKKSLSFDFAAGESYASSYPHKLKRNHGLLNIFGWGVLLPVGALIARYGNKRKQLWYYLHLVVQFTGFFVGLAGVVAGVSLRDRLHANVTAHRGLGIFILVLAILQVLAFFLRPDKDSKNRRYWNWYHHWVGRSALLLAVVNISVGIKVGGASNSWKVGYGSNLAILLIITFILEVLLHTRWSKNAIDTPVPF